MQKKIYGKYRPSYTPSRAIPELKPEILTVPCRRTLPNGDILIERQIRFGIIPRTGADAKLVKTVLNTLD